jgi:KaiC/GvpD/RAD55 family RecA-like ATPase
MNLMNSKKFGLLIEDIVKKKKITYMDAVIKYCEDNDIDLSSVGPLVNKSLKEKIKEEAQKLNMVEKSSTAVLPI